MALLIMFVMLQLVNATVNLTSLVNFVMRLKMDGGISQPLKVNSFDLNCYLWFSKNIIFLACECHTACDGCIHDWTYSANSKSYYGCTRDTHDGSNDSKEWCATEVDKDGIYQSGSGKWKYCDADCHVSGSSGSKSTVCDKSTGKCDCNDNVVGDKCTQCESGYWGFPSCQGGYLF